MLEINKLNKRFKGLLAINDVSFNIGKDEIVGVIGPNGAGKTTFFNLITGFLKPTSGKISFEGKDITGLSPHTIASYGIVRTFQLDRIYHEFTVLENVVIASHLQAKIGFWEAIFNTGRYRSQNRNAWNNAVEILKFLGIENKRNETAASLSHGHQRLLGIAIALAAKPKLLLLDEPLSGMNAEEVNKTQDIIQEIRKRGISVLLIEHNMRAVMRTCDRLMVLNFGTEIASGTRQEIQNNPEVIKAYLGAQKHAAWYKGSRY
jgi:branched-chain amino acid transport system ATP-binding protein